MSFNAFFFIVKNLSHTLFVARAAIKDIRVHTSVKRLVDGPRWCTTRHRCRCIVVSAFSFRYIYRAWKYQRISWVTLYVCVCAFSAMREVYMCSIAAAWAKGTSRRARAIHRKPTRLFACGAAFTFYVYVCLSPANNVHHTSRCVCVCVLYTFAI